MPENPRFLKIKDVADELNISSSQTYAILRSGDLPAIQVGGRNQWRIERVKLEEYIERMYVEAKPHLKELGEDGAEEDKA